MPEDKENQQPNIVGNPADEAVRTSLPEQLQDNTRVRDPFAVRMCEAGYTVGRKYDEIKNEFLRYRSQGKTYRQVKSQLIRDGELLTAGRTAIAKICLVSGYLRLFLALDPKQYNKDKYHHKDCSETAKYARFPFMIKISSDRQMKYAKELIATVMANVGYVPNPDYEYGDQAHIFLPFKKKRGADRPTDTADIAVPPVISIAPEEACAAESGESEEIPVVSAILADGADAAAERSDPPAPSPVEQAAQTVLSEDGPARVQFGLPRPDDNPIAEEKVRVHLPVYATVVDKSGEKIGSIRKSVWYADGDERVGEFVRQEDDGVAFYRDEVRAGYLDKNNNVLTETNRYLGTVRYFRWWLLLLALGIMAVIVVLSSLLAAAYLSRSEEIYAPKLFVAENGREWEKLENLSVFFNEKYNDSKIEPGMTGSYAFSFENPNPDAIAFSLAFSCDNPYAIGLEYRLRRDGAYIAGVNGYVSPAELSCEGLTLEANSSSVFEIEWQWAHNDDVDTAAGENLAQYSLYIQITAVLRTDPADGA